MIQNFKVLVLVFPELLKIIRSIVNMVKESEDKKALDENTKEISDAFREGNSEKLNAVFSKLRNRP